MRHVQRGEPSPWGVASAYPPLNPALLPLRAPSCDASCDEPTCCAASHNPALAQPPTVTATFCDTAICVRFQQQHVSRQGHCYLLASTH
eukprot:1068631-Prymnesium_polylepis.3